MTKRRETDEEFWNRVAYHEAGHAVANIMAERTLSGEPLSFDKVVIRPGITGPLDGRGRDGGEEGLLGRLCGGTIYDVNGSWRDHYRDPLARAELEIIIQLAGPFAEAALFDRTKANMWATALLYCGGNRDYAYAEGHVFPDLCKLAGRRVSWRKLENRTRELVLECWPAIKAVAEHLLVKHELSAWEVYALAEPHLPEKGEGGRWAVENDLPPRRVRRGPATVTIKRIVPPRPPHLGNPPPESPHRDQAEPPERN